MKEWNFKVNRSPNAVSESLEASLGSLNGYVLNVKNEDNNLISFRIRKRLLYAWYMIYHNNVIVTGKLSKASVKNETNVDISFSQHFLWKFVIFAHLFLGLCFLIAIILGQGNTSSYIFAALTLVIGIFLWFRLQKKHERNIQEYKTLISKTLGF